MKISGDAVVVKRELYEVWESIYESFKGPNSKLDEQVGFMSPSRMGFRSLICYGLSGYDSPPMFGFKNGP